MHPLNPFNLTTSARPIRYFAFALLGMTLALSHVAADPDSVHAEKVNTAVVGVAPAPQGDAPALAAPPPKAKKKKKAAPRSVQMVAVPAETVLGIGIGAAVKSPPPAATPAFVAVPAILPTVAEALVTPASGLAKNAAPAAPPAPAAPSPQGAAVAANGATVAANGATVAASGATVAASGATVAASGATVAASGATVAASGATVAASGATVAAEAVTPVAEAPAPKQRRQLGMRSTTVKKTAAAGGIVRKDIIGVVPPTGRIAGRVLSKDGVTMLSGAELILDHSVFGSQHRVVTDSSGNFEIELPIGQYELAIQRRDEIFESPSSYSVARRGTLPVDFILLRDFEEQPADPPTGKESTSGGDVSRQNDATLAEDRWLPEPHRQPEVVGSVVDLVAPNQDDPERSRRKNGAETAGFLGSILAILLVL